MTVEEYRRFISETGMLPATGIHELIGLRRRLLDGWRASEKAMTLAQYSREIAALTIAIELMQDCIALDEQEEGQTNAPTTD